MTDQPQLLGIGEFARRSRLSLKALRLYDRLDLLKPASVDVASGYRRYDAAQVADARLISALRGLDMPLAEIGRVLSEPEALARAALVRAFWEESEVRILGQRQLASVVIARLSGTKGDHEMFEVKQRDVPAQRVASEKRNLLVGELPAWLADAFGRLTAAADRAGGIGGPGFVIYHGEVSGESDGPVEVCVPIAAGASVAGAETRTIDAHQEAFVRIRKSDVRYPHILSAYEAVAESLATRGESPVGPPREVYFADFEAAAPDDEVCDVAFPIAAR